MRILRNRFVYFLFILFIVFYPFAGCSNSLTEKQELEINKIVSTPINAETGRIDIQFTQWSVSSTKLIEEEVNWFNETNKDNININVLEIPLERYVETLNMLNASGSGPDVFEVFREWLNSYIYKGWAADISPFINDSFLKKFPEWAVDFAIDSLNHNSFYSIPSGQITYRLIYNKDFFREVGLDPEAPPKTLSELVRYAKTISDAGKGKRKYGFALPMGEVWVNFVQMMEATNCYSGVYFFDFKKGRYDLTVYKPWLDAMKDMNENGGMFPGMDSMKSSLAMAQFAEGNIGMMYVASWEVSLLFHQFLPKCEWGVALPPAIDESSSGKGVVAINTAGWNVVNSGTKYLNEAVKVWKFLYSKDYLGDLFRDGSILPIVEGLLKDPDYMPSTATNFNRFMPGKEDSVYPNTPLNMDEWLRKNAYIAALSGNQTDKALLEENNRLNILFNNAVAANRISIDKYSNPDFDMSNPIR